MGRRFGEAEDSLAIGAAGVHDGAEMILVLRAERGSTADSTEVTKQVLQQVRLWASVAIEADEAGRSDEAVVAYRAAARHLSTILDEVPEQNRPNIIARHDQYQSRADELSAPLQAMAHKRRSEESLENYREAVLRGEDPSSPCSTERRAECAICLERAREVAFDPCGHLIVCTVCAEDCSECPVCRVEVRRKIRTYLA